MKILTGDVRPIRVRSKEDIKEWRRQEGIEKKTYLGHLRKKYLGIDFNSVDPIYIEAFETLALASLYLNKAKDPIERALIKAISDLTT
jgi:hypothetical protein